MEGVKLLTERDIRIMWSQLLQEPEFTSETVTKAEALLNELRPESPLWHRLSAQLAAIREHIKPQGTSDKHPPN